MDAVELLAGKPETNGWDSKESREDDVVEFGRESQQTCVTC